MASFTDYLYDKSVEGLFYLSRLTGFTYREVNVLVFCVIEPLVYLALLIIVVRQRKRINDIKSTSSLSS